MSFKLGIALALAALAAAALPALAPTALFRTENRPGGAALFVGDIMLARYVETLSRAHGFAYPYEGVRALHARYPVVVGNFEAAMAVSHEHTPNFAMRFSVAQDLLPALAASGVTHLSLANNHTLDYGDEGYGHARTALATEGFAAFGHPVRLGEESVAYFDTGGVQVAVVGVNATWRTPSADELAAAFAAASKADVQVAYVHWGEEYELVHSEAQETLALTLIGLGADVIIGTHPHVVQDIGIHDGVPIFYSLGNYIFDQYFDEHVEEGLALGITFSPDAIAYELIPIRSERSVPAPMAGEERDAFLAGIAARSAPRLQEDIRRGAFTSAIR